MEPMTPALIAGSCFAALFLGPPIVDYLIERRYYQFYKTQMEPYLKQSGFGSAGIERPRKPKFRDVLRSHYGI